MTEATPQAEGALRETILNRLQADGKAGAPLAQLILAALEGQEAVEGLLESGLIPEAAAGNGMAPSPIGAYVTSITVEGFRGIGARASLGLVPGPGLTLVVGRNGSGKSSFAEALEVLFTDDNQRWARRSAVWREGWRNLHHQQTEIGASLAVEGLAGETAVTRTWEVGADLEESDVEVQPHGLPKTNLAFLGWEGAMAAYRPFLSYSELGAMFDEGPTKIHDAVSAVLGLEELDAAAKALRDSRLERERGVKEVDGNRDRIAGSLERLDDERAVAAVAALRTRPPNLGRLKDLVTVGATGPPTSDLGILQRLAAFVLPQPSDVKAAARELREAQTELADLAGSQADELLRGADLLEAAVRFRDDFPGTDCPVCSTPEVITKNWSEAALDQASVQRKAALEAETARTRAQAALRKARKLIGPVPDQVRDARGVLDVEPVIAAWAGWVELEDEDDPQRLADGLEHAIGPLASAIEAVQRAAEGELRKREDAWRPIAMLITTWVGDARAAYERAEAVRPLKEAEAWLKSASVAIRNDRFAPIADEAMAIWRLLRQRSNVELGHIELEGTGNRRRVTLDVTVDGVEGAALGVMSQGELHALALSLFFPRAMLPESPFRFVVIDDPVQSMDPAKVDGLARVLERAAKARQVVVFTHDDRLAEAVRRLGVDATILEVARKEGSLVEIRPSLDPVERYLEDARAVARTAELPNEARTRVVPGFCRLALEAACIQAARRRRIGRGEAHADVEELLTASTKLTVFAALALFDDEKRGGDVLTRINSSFGRRAGDVFQAVNKGAHAGAQGNLDDLIRDAAILSRELAQVG
jgi:predicted ATPase